MLETIESLFYVAIAAAFVVVALRDRLSSPQTPGRSRPRSLRRGEIDATKFERQLEFHVDDRNEQIRVVVVEDINGVGPATSKAIAREYESLEALRTSDRERLESVYGVGGQTSGAVLERIQWDDPS